MNATLIICTILLSHYPAERGLHQVGNYQDRATCERAGANFMRGAPGPMRSYSCFCDTREYSGP